MIHYFSLVEGSFEDYHKAKVHIQHPEKPFDAKVGETPLESLQLCFDQATLNSFTSRMQGPNSRDVSLMTTLDMARPEVQSFVRHATLIWSEILSGGAIINSSMITQESVHLLQALLISAAEKTSEKSTILRPECNSAGVLRAEEYLMSNLSNPISIADVANVAGISARSLSREFRRHRGSTIKEFIRDRRLEAANRLLLAAEPGETTVSLVAFDLGFKQLGRFSRDYKNTFGELPSETLAR